MDIESVQSLQSLPKDVLLMIMENMKKLNYFKLVKQYDKSISVYSMDDNHWTNVLKLDTCILSPNPYIINFQCTTNYRCGLRLLVNGDVMFEMGVARGSSGNNTGFVCYNGLESKKLEIILQARTPIGISLNCINSILMIKSIN